MAEKKKGRGRIVFLLWLLIGVLYFLIVSDYVAVAMDDNEFGEYLQFSVNLVVSQQRSPDDLRSLVLAKARELEIPIDPVNVSVEGSGESLQLRANYGVIVDFPIVAAGYRKEFEHIIGYRPGQ
jgi:hypothetical protein